MSELIDDLLDLSRISRAMVYLEELDLSREVGRIAEALQKREPERRVRFVIAEEVPRRPRTVFS